MGLPRGAMPLIVSALEGQMDVGLVAKRVAVAAVAAATLAR